MKALGAYWPHQIGKKELYFHINADCSDPWTNDSIATVIHEDCMLLEQYQTAMNLQTDYIHESKQGSMLSFLNGSLKLKHWLVE